MNQQYLDGPDQATEYNATDLQNKKAPKALIGMNKLGDIREKTGGTKICLNVCTTSPCK